MADLFGAKLIDRGAADAEIGAGGFHHRHAGQKIGRFGIVAIARVAGLLVESRQDEDFAFVIFERLERIRQFVVGTGLFGNPVALPNAVGKIKAGHPHRRPGTRCRGRANQIVCPQPRGKHGAEQGQSETGTATAQKCATRDRLHFDGGSFGWAGLMSNAAQVERWRAAI